jgi:membrane protein DedA with SNARE-associated domain
VDRKILLWSLVLFFGSAILFRAIDAAVSDGKVSLAIQAGVLVVIVGAIVAINRHRSK